MVSSTWYREQSVVGCLSSPSSTTPVVEYDRMTGGQVPRRAGPTRGFERVREP